MKVQASDTGIIISVFCCDIFLETSASANVCFTSESFYGKAVYVHQSIANFYLDCEKLAYIIPATLSITLLFYRSCSINRTSSGSNSGVSKYY